MKPPTNINVIDKHGGFTALTKSATYEKEYVGSAFVGWRKVWRERDSLWRPGSLLADPVGELQEFNEKSFFQLNNNVTKAIYKVKGYPNRIAVWFDNETGERIA